MPRFPRPRPPRHVRPPCVLRTASILPSYPPHPAIISALCRAAMPSNILPASPRAPASVHRRPPSALPLLEITIGIGPRLTSITPSQRQQMLHSPYVETQSTHKRAPMHTADPIALPPSAGLAPAYSACVR
ncbi:uncharacterized protein B0H18DRAFT_270021 [Fomitopsis serialis]|uniref:uncharacterized protein n=1 Tax=Fomitopsis serialis TaxID=139415 RepID=UPI0020078A61|nr:uncharacterized protein B0H18DRAFT_270021 [Neoantrodia serialis]KAH9912178.1 hypothetical protein B0H18DRAFT_270021 [Neoantrodia serialis]